MDSPSPTVPAPGGLNHIDFEEDYLNTQAFDPISTQAQVPSSTQAPVDGHTPPTTRVPSPRRTNKTRKGKVISEFHENYLAYKREETSQYCVIMEKNVIRSTERADKFSVAVAIEAYQCSILGYEMADFVYACDMFITKSETREAFVSIAEERRADWIKSMVDLYKSNK
ncbi:hypothetical protein FCM35_KLT21654 [Carex littledalei]|uniref:Uncharacterized protein n=1 Tax=Carex littledalei TaxID=544730 RepID=A0A833QXP1_9POAL|nr:hypothetical protein FCM35_KLT21654 [Carex littledalei]